MKYKLVLSALVFVGISASFMGSVKPDNPRYAPPATNLYMKYMQGSEAYKDDLKQALTGPCNNIFDQYQGRNDVEAIYKLRFAKEVLTGGGALNFCVSALTNTTNHTDIGSAETGLSNCANDFNSRLDVLVKGFYQIQF